MPSGDSVPGTLGAIPRHDLPMPRRRQIRNLRGTEHKALAQPPAGQGHGMGEDRALRLVERNGSEAHQPRLSRSVIWARMDSAISAGLRAPMSSPTGAWMRAICASGTPAVRSLSSRFAWVRGEPRQPM